jgi:hypothetical protein
VQDEATMLRTTGGKAGRRTVRRRQSPGGREAGEVGEEAARVPGADGGGPAAWQGARVSADFRRPAAVENPMGQRTGAPRKRWSGRMTAAAEEEDTTTTMAADRGRKSG